MSELAKTSIEVERLGKTFALYRSPSDRLREALHPLRKKYHQDFHALSDVSFTVRRGETVGIIGKNGSGKSTLLKIITGVLTPTTGRVSAPGRISALLELGTGFHPDISGIENVFFTGAILGIGREQMEKRLPEILDFADIGEYAKQPVKSYSSGMFVRLAFAVAIHVDPEILIVDEALSVGDIRFQQKCYRKIRSFKEQGVTILFVSHDTAAIISFCDRCIWMKDGRVERDGVPSDVVREYVAHMFYDAESEQALPEKKAHELPEGTPWTKTGGLAAFGDRGAEIEQVALLDKTSREQLQVLSGGEDVVYALDVVFHTDMSDVIYGVVVKDARGNQVLVFNTYAYELTPKRRRAGERVRIELGFRFPRLANGDYTISPSIAEGSQAQHVQHHWVHDASVVSVARNDWRNKIGSVLVLDGLDLEELTR